MRIAKHLGLLATAALFAGCNNGELRLAGDRLTPRETIASADAEAAAPLNAQPVAVAIALPGPQNLADWTQKGGNAAHAAGHVAYSGALTPVWTVNAGRGDSRKNRISADPVVAGGRVFTLDAAATVTATGTNGGTLWRADLTPPTDRNGEASGGGLAYGDGAVFATTGYGELVALNSATGAVLWRQNLESGVGGAPAVAGGKVFVAARDGTAWAVTASDGRVAWTAPSLSGRAGVSGAAAPTVSGDKVIFPFASGELLALNVADGTPVWQGFVAGQRLGRAYASLSDLTGEPVAAGGKIYAGSSSGRLAALDGEKGSILWSAPEGASSPAVLAGGSLFIVNDEDQLLRLDASSGAETWRIDLPYYKNVRKDKKRKGIYAYYGPVLAGGRLIISSSDGLIRAFDPASGKLVGSADIKGGAASAPVVAGGTLYVLSKSGQLHAFR
jgi:outer membrane protein assembly factor BamB